MSRNGKKNSVLTRNDQPDPKVLTALEKAFRHFNTAGPAATDRRTYDFVFHMTDWYPDLVYLAKVYADPAAYDQAEWNDAVFQFLIHAVSHLMAAAKLNGTLYDPFDVMKQPKPRKRRPATSRR
jgi:hypothetical protein